MRNYPLINVPKGKFVQIIGDDPSRYSAKGFPFFHIPMLGGWKNYVIIEAKDFGKYWNVGWIVKFKNSKEVVYQIQALRIHSPFVKLLTGINDSEKLFFAIGEDGSFVDIRMMDRGSLGDGRYKTVRLF
ncbi:MAG: hypothetical protein HYV38_01910 [Candidatus Levybacteria bacterium]|nr:hypothetical protein [Candidatus Levybacteria bacterium]MBI2420816.1 hypothetical protein [Candidatus Levybacteria bacterium]